jgi:hypothetical protein
MDCSRLSVSNASQRRGTFITIDKQIEIRNGIDEEQQE